MIGETIEQVWQTYNDTVLSKTAGPVQRVETRRAFYGGAWAILNMLIAHAAEPEAVAVEHIKRWHKESKDFKNAVERGEA